MTLYEITVLDGAAAGTVLRATEPVRIGSDPTCEIVLPDPGVAPVHAVVAPSGGEHLVRSEPGVRVSKARSRGEGAAARVASLSTLALLDVGPVTLLFHQLGGVYVSEPAVKEPARGLPPRRAPAAIHRIAQLSRSRAIPAVAMIDEDRLLVAGGEPPMRGEPEYADADVVSLAAHETRTIPLRAARAGATATRLGDGRVLIAGGRTEEVEILDPRTLVTTPAASMCASRTCARACLIAGDRVLVLGGQHAGPYDRSPHVAEVYDAARDTWTSIPGPPMSRVVAAQLDATRFLVATDRGLLAPLPPTTYFVLDTETFAFHPIAPPARARRNPVLVALGGGRAVVIGGIPPSGPGVARAVDLFDLATQSFTATGDLRAPRLYPEAAALDGDRVLVVGGDNAYQGLYSAEVLDVARGAWSGLPAVREGMNPSAVISLPRSAELEERPGASPPLAAPGLAAPGDTAVVVGFADVALARGEAWPPPGSGSPGPRAASHAGIRFRSAVGWAPRGQEHADMFCPRPGGAAVIALFRGVVGYCGDVAADVCRWTLAELLGAPAYGTPLPVATATPPRDVRSHHGLWTSHLLDRAPLPGDAGELPAVLAARVDAVIGAMNTADPRFGATAEGVIACVSPGRARLVRRGGARVYLVHDGQVSLVVPEHSVIEDMIEQGQLTPEMLDQGLPEEAMAMFRNMSASCFGRTERIQPAVDLAVRPGDRLVMLTHALCRAASDAELAAWVADPSFAALIARAEQEERGYGVVSVTIPG